MIKKEKLKDRHCCIYAYSLPAFRHVKYCSVQRNGKPCFALVGNAVCDLNYTEFTKEKKK